MRRDAFRGITFMVSAKEQVALKAFDVCIDIVQKVCDPAVPFEGKIIPFLVLLGGCLLVYALLKDVKMLLAKLALERNLGFFNIAVIFLALCVYFNMEHPDKDLAYADAALVGMVSPVCVLVVRLSIATENKRV